VHRTNIHYIYSVIPLRLTTKLVPIRFRRDDDGKQNSVSEDPRLLSATTASL